MVKEDAMGNSQTADKQTVSFSLALETVEKLRQRAAQQGQSLEVYLQLLTTRNTEERTGVPPPSSDGHTVNGEPIALRLEPASEQKLREKARSAGLTIEEYLEELAEREAAARPSRLERELAWLASRTKEDVEATRQALLSASRPARSVPEGQTLADVVEGKWPGDETDEQVRSALDRLS
jgi:hypothetical protein